VTTDRTRTLCLIPPCSCKEHFPITFILLYFILFGFAVRSFAVRPTEPLANTLRLNYELFNFTEWYDFSFFKQNALKLKFRYKCLWVLVTVQCRHIYVHI
jgi:hypothetical protein